MAGNSLCHQACERPVRGGPAPVEQAGLRKQQRAGAHGDDASRVRCDGADPGHHVGVGAGVVDPDPAGHEHGVDALTRIGQRHRHEAQPRAAADRPPVRRCKRHLVAAVQQHRCAGEHIKRADHVQRLDARKAENHDLACHVSSVRHLGSWRLCHVPHKLGRGYVFASSASLRQCSPHCRRAARHSHPEPPFCRRQADHAPTIPAISLQSASTPATSHGATG